MISQSLIHKTFAFALVLAFSVFSYSADAEQRLGFSLGTPSAINLYYLADLGEIPVHARVGYWGDVDGFELGFHFYEYSDWLSLALVAGHGTYNDTDNRPGEGRDRYSYFGLVGNFSYKGFYVEPGIAAGEGDYSNPQILFNLGYSFRIAD